MTAEQKASAAVGGDLSGHKNILLSRTLKNIMILIIEISLTPRRVGETDQDPSILSEAVELLFTILIFCGDCLILPPLCWWRDGTTCKKKRNASNNSELLGYGFHIFV
jgi:hypothetical protein